MNYLAHLALAGPEPGLVVGGFLGDFIKGTLENRFQPEVERGIRLHRAIDRYTDSHERVRMSIARFEPPFRRYAGIITDLAFDHLLAKSWSDYYAEPLVDFSRRTLAELLDHEDLQSGRARMTATRMHQHNSLAGYRDTEFLARSLEYTSTRLSRANPLAEAFEPCIALLPHLKEDLAIFYPELMDFCGEWKTAH